MAHGPSPDDWRQAHRLLTESAVWENLAFDGIQHAGGRRLMEARRCPDCGSTINRPIDAAGAAALLHRFSEVVSVSMLQVGLSLTGPKRASS